MRSSRRRASGLLVRAALGLAACATLCAWPAAAQVPDGIEVGPWVLAPVLRSFYSYESNPFRNVGESSSDGVAEVQAGLTATLPFRMSRLRLDYTGGRVEYGSDQTGRNLALRAGLELGLAFRTGDRLTLRDNYRRDITRPLAFDNEGLEEVFDGEPFSSNRWDIELDRADPGRRGYLVRVRRQDYTFDDNPNTGQFEYRGFDNVFEYRQPLTSYRSWTLRYGMARFNHYLPAAANVGQPFRREESDSLMYGLRGQFGEAQPYHVQLGYQRFRYRLEPGSPPAGESTGLVAAITWRLAIGGRTHLNFNVDRRALPSSSDTYYIGNALRVELDRRWLRYRTGATARMALNEYGQATGDCGSGTSRRDSLWFLEARQGWKVHERLEIEVVPFHERRSSNCEVDFNATGVRAGLSLGWF